MPYKDPEQTKECKRRWREKHRAEKNAAEREAYWNDPDSYRERARVRAAAWRKRNPDRAKEVRRNWQERNPGLETERMREWRKANPEQSRQINREVYWRNPERGRASVKKWRECNPDQVLAMNKRSRARKRGVEIHEPWTTRQILERDEWTCQLKRCLHPEGRKISENVKRHDRWEGTADHIIPLARGGADAPFNLQAAHRACNSSKYTSIEGGE